MSIHLYSTPFDDLDELKDEHGTAQSLLEELFSGSDGKIIDQRVVIRVQKRIEALQPQVRQQLKAIIQWYRQSIFKACPMPVSSKKEPISHAVFERSKMASELLMRKL